MMVSLFVRQQQGRRAEIPGGDSAHQGEIGANSGVRRAISGENSAHLGAHAIHS
ncbi:MAG: hypothetical protein J0L72_11855 [Armatimonadetes bacterium]|nr:hypothetical protein [Armatimonadota bacterium]